MNTIVNPLNKQAIARYNIADGKITFVYPTPDSMTFYGAYPLVSGKLVAYRDVASGDIERVVFNDDGTETSVYSFTGVASQLNRASNKQVFVGNVVVDALDDTLRAFSTVDHSFKWSWNDPSAQNLDYLDAPWVFPGNDRVYAMTYDGADAVSIYALNILDGSVLASRSYNLAVDNSILGMFGTNDYLVLVEINETNYPTPILVLVDKTTLAEIDRWLEGTNV